MPTPNERLRRERQLRGWSQVHLAEQIGVPDYYISRWERGDVLPSPYYQQKLCTVFGKTAEELGMLQSKGETVPLREPETDNASVAAASSTAPLVEQLPFPEEPLSPQFSPPSPTPPTLAAIPPAIPSPPLQQAEAPRPVQRRKLLLVALAILVLLSAGAGTLLLTRKGSTTAANAIVGHLYFESSGQVTESSNQGVADEVELELPSLPSPSPGKSYYAWLLPDASAPENPVVPLGRVTLSGGSGHLFYGDPQHQNLLAMTSRFLITEQDAAITPINPSTDRSDWRYTGQLPQIIAPGGQYSLLDHLRHLLAEDPKLKANHMAGGLAIWLYRNTQAISAWSTSARDAWQAGGSANASVIRQNVIRILDYLDGIPFVGRDLPVTIATPVLVDSRIGRVGLLQFDPQQALPGYLHHIDLHLNGLTSSPGATAVLQQRAAQIIAAMNTVSNWLEEMRQDARQLAAMTDAQLGQQPSLTLLDDLATTANFAYVGKSDPVTGARQEGVEWIYQQIQSLATIDITPYRGAAS